MSAQVLLRSTATAGQSRLLLDEWLLLDETKLVIW
jgi:hypothetical protein